MPCWNYPDTSMKAELESRVLCAKSHRVLQGHILRELRAGCLSLPSGCLTQAGQMRLTALPLPLKEGLPIYSINPFLKAKVKLLPYWSVKCGGAGLLAFRSKHGQIKAIGSSDGTDAKNRGRDRRQMGNFPAKGPDKLFEWTHTNTYNNCKPPKSAHSPCKCIFTI